jgi:hypothetical protein
MQAFVDKVRSLRGPARHAPESLLFVVIYVILLSRSANAPARAL